MALRRSGWFKATSRTPVSSRLRVTGSTAADGTVRRVIAGYQHFLRLASRAQWDDEAIDLSADAAAWPEVATEEIAELVAGFCVGEAGVAEHLRPFFEDRYAKEVFDVQRNDEERHDRFFARYAEAVGLEPEDHVSEEFAELFTVRLPAAARASGVEAVGVYHMVLEGVVFTA